MSELMEWLNNEVVDCTASAENLYYAGRFAEAVRIRAKIGDTLNGIAEEICDHYCRFPEAYPANEHERMIEEKCNNCPLNKIAE